MPCVYFGAPLEVIGVLSFGGGKQLKKDQSRVGQSHTKQSVSSTGCNVAQLSKQSYDENVKYGLVLNCDRGSKG